MPISHALYVCQGPACSAHGARDVLAAALQAAERLEPTHPVTVLPSGCRSRCEEAVTAALFPGGRKLCFLTTENVGRALALALSDSTRATALTVQRSRVPLRPRRWR